MMGEHVTTHSFKKKNQILTMASSYSIKVSNEHINIYPQVLFQRFITAGMRNEQLPQMFQYELSSYPPALFDMKNMMKTANKPALADAMWALMPQDSQRPSEDDCIAASYSMAERKYI